MIRPPASFETVARPAMCPFCRGKIFDTLAKVLNELSCWRCRTCERTWTIAGMRVGGRDHPRVT